VSAQVRALRCKWQQRGNDVFCCRASQTEAAFKPASCLQAILKCSGFKFGVVRKIDAQDTVRGKTSFQKLQPFAITGHSASWGSCAPGKKVIDDEIKTRPPVPRNKSNSILTMNFRSRLIDSKVCSCHFDMNGLLLYGGELCSCKQCLQLQHRGAGTKPEDQNPRGLRPGMKIQAKPQQIPYAAGDEAAGIELTVKDAVGIQTDARPGTPDLIVPALMAVGPQNGYRLSPLSEL